MAARSGVTWYIPGLDNGRRVEKRYQKQCAHREVRGTRFFTSHIRLFTVCSVGFHLLCRLSEVDVRNHFYFFVLVTNWRSQRVTYSQKHE